MMYFGSLPKAAFTLFMAITGGIDWEYAVNPLFTTGVLSVLIWLVYIIFSSFCLMNVIIGIFCQNAVEAFEQDKEKVIEHQLADRSRESEKLTAMFQRWDS